MTISDLIESDYQDLKAYFDQLFKLLENTTKKDQSLPLTVTDNPEHLKHNFSHLIKPDMVINIYSFLEYWLITICNHYQKSQSLSLSHKDIKGKNDLNVYYKYLSQYVGLDLSEVNDDYKKLQQLREIRNILIHNGGYIKQDQAQNILTYKEIELFDDLLIIKEEFIWEMLDKTKYFLLNVTSSS